MNGAADPEPSKGTTRVYKIQPGSEEDRKNIVEQGFTLVELLIVIVIMGILAGIVVFAVGNLTDTANKNSCITESDTVRTSVAAYKAANANAIPDWSELTDATSGTLDGSSVKFRDTTGTPGANEWYYNETTGAVTEGASCQ